MLVKHFVPLNNHGLEYRHLTFFDVFDFCHLIILCKRNKNNYHRLLTCARSSGRLGKTAVWLPWVVVRAWGSWGGLYVRNFEISRWLGFATIAGCATCKNRYGLRFCSHQKFIVFSAKDIPYLSLKVSLRGSLISEDIGARRPGLLMVRSKIC